MNKEQIQNEGRNKKWKKERKTKEKDEIK